ncbi:hypothetical protein BD626DRAFT_576918 [Schizophyllum amplum]|uniref:Uncharacterized protein n=1 Tax=Schizophyllum amplum TaxID=97359 RepID=A0A550BSV2_9AGAR|nr:hypothetical protein BD626DRAFT_576918 [Auriculariopsis ampla]
MTPTVPPAPPWIVDNVLNNSAILGVWRAAMRCLGILLVNATTPAGNSARPQTPISQPPPSPMRVDTDTRGGAQEAHQSAFYGRYDWDALACAPTSAWTSYSVDEATQGPQTCAYALDAGKVECVMCKLIALLPRATVWILDRGRKAPAPALRNINAYEVSLNVHAECLAAVRNKYIWAIADLSSLLAVAATAVVVVVYDELAVHLVAAVLLTAAAIVEHTHAVSGDEAVIAGLNRLYLLPPPCTTRYVFIAVGHDLDALTGVEDARGTKVVVNAGNQHGRQSRLPRGNADSRRRTRGRVRVF